MRRLFSQHSSTLARSNRPGDVASKSGAHSPARAERIAGSLVESLESRTFLSATHLVILPTFDASITNDPQATAIEAAINSAINVYQTEFSTPITVRIYFKEGRDLGSSDTMYDTVSYSAYRAALAAHASGANDALALASLPKTSGNPVNGDSQIDLTNPNARALGFRTSHRYDSTITLGPSQCNLTRTSIDPNKYDLESLAMHEIDEALGFGSDLDGSFNGDPAPGGPVSAEDLFRYAKKNQRSYTTNIRAAAFFSIDGGATDLAQFNQDAGGDFGDWFSANGNQVPQVQDAFGTPGVISNLNVELTGLDVMGYTAARNLGTGIITGVVFNDANRNAVRDRHEAILPGWTIQAFQHRQLITQAVSDAGGYELTGLAPGKYNILEVPQGGFSQTTSSFTLTITGADQTLAGEDFGDASP